MSGELKGHVETVGETSEYSCQASASVKVARIVCVLDEGEVLHGSLTLRRPLNEAEYWPLGMPVTVTVEKGEPDGH